MEKPANMSLKDFLILKASQQLEIEECIVDRVISWSFEKANKATQLHSEIEISGFGKMFISQPKTKRRIKKLDNILNGTFKKLENCTEENCGSLNKRVDNLNSI